MHRVETSKAAKLTLSASTQTCGHQNKGGKRRVVLAGCQASGGSLPRKYLKTGRASFRRNYSRQVLSCLYNNNNNNITTTATSTSGNICSSAMITRHCDDTGDTSGKKQTRSPCPVGHSPLRKEQKKEEGTFLGTACPGLYMLTCSCFRPIQ